jgi:transcriptional regulator EpsA
MTRYPLLSDDDLECYIRLIRQALGIRRHVDLLFWLQGEVQRFLPHEIMLSAWGDFRLGLIAHDIVSPLPGVRTGRTRLRSVSPMLSGMFERWLELGRTPFVMRLGEAGFDFDDTSLESDVGVALRRVRSVLVHGICDERGRHDCLYLLLSTGAFDTEAPRAAMEVLLPYLDTAMRQVPLLQADAPPAAATEDASFNAGESPLSEREVEIMTWVKLGKTNQEVGMILDISAFTVKNHLKRIFRKLDVFNRMQAVAKFESSSLHATH